MEHVRLRENSSWWRILVSIAERHSHRIDCRNRNVSSSSWTWDINVAAVRARTSGSRSSGWIPSSTHNNNSSSPLPQLRNTLNGRGLHKISANTSPFNGSDGPSETIIKICDTCNHQFHVMQQHQGTQLFHQSNQLSK